MSLTMSSLTLLCIFSDILNILQLTNHDLRDTRDNRVKVHAPQPIGFTFLTLRHLLVGRLLLPAELGVITSGMLVISKNGQHARLTSCWMHDVAGLGAGAASLR